MFRSAANFLAKGVAKTRPPDGLAASACGCGLGGAGGGTGTAASTTGAAGATGLGACSTFAAAGLAAAFNSGLKLANAATSSLLVTMTHSGF